MCAAVVILILRITQPAFGCEYVGVPEKLIELVQATAPVHAEGLGTRKSEWMTYLKLSGE